MVQNIEEVTQGQVIEGIYALVPRGDKTTLDALAKELGVSMDALSFILGGCPGVHCIADSVWLEDDHDPSTPEQIVEALQPPGQRIALDLLAKRLGVRDPSDLIIPLRGCPGARRIGEVVWVEPEQVRSVTESTAGDRCVKALLDLDAERKAHEVTKRKLDELRVALAGSKKAHLATEELRARAAAAARIAEDAIAEALELTPQAAKCRAYKDAYDVLWSELNRMVLTMRNLWAMSHEHGVPIERELLDVHLGCADGVLKRTARIAEGS